MRLGKRLAKSRFWKEAGETTSGRPQHISPKTVVGRVSLDLIATDFAPKLLSLADETLEQYAEDMMIYQDAMKELHAATATATPEEAQIESDGTIHSSTNNNSATTTTTTTQPPPIPPSTPLFRSQYRIHEFQTVLTEVSDHFFSKNAPGWKVEANAAKFERLLDEKYGIFRPIITRYPQVEQALRSVQRKYAAGELLSPFRHGAPPIPRSTAVILLFMMQRNKMRWEILVLTALFLLVGLQPWALVGVVVLVQWLIQKRKMTPIGTMRRTVPLTEPYYHYHHQRRQSQKDAAASAAANTGSDTDGTDPTTKADPATEQKRKEALLLRPVGAPLKSGEVVDMDLYDTILLGHGAPTLYTAAILSRAGRKVLVLSGRTDASGSLTLRRTTTATTAATTTTTAAASANLPFDVEPSNVAKISQQQAILAPALCHTSDCQGGIRFAQVGSQADGYAFEVLSIPGVGTERHDESVPFVVTGQGGLQALMDDAATYLGDGWPGQGSSSTGGGSSSSDSANNVGQSTVGAYVAACTSINASASVYYLSKILPEQVNGLRGTCPYQDSAIRYAGSFLDRCFPLNAHTRSLMAGIGMKGENIKPSKTSMAAVVTNTCSAISSSSSSGEGMHYPVGGPRALCQALATVVEQCGGRVVTDVQTHELLFDVKDENNTTKSNPNKKAPASTEEGAEDGAPAPRCVGVKLVDGTELRFPNASQKSASSSSSSAASAAAADPVVLSMEGFIDTFVRLLPDDIRTRYKVPRGLPALSERRPVFKILVALKGSARDLDITGADYYRLPNAAIARDQMDPVTGEISYGVIGGPDEDAEEEGTVDLAEAVNQDEANEGAPKEGSTTSTIPKKKGRRNKFDAGRSWISISFPSAKDPSFESRHGKVSTCVITIEADDDFVTAFETKPQMYVINKPTSATKDNVDRLLERVRKDLVDIYPQLEDKMEHLELHGPYRKGLTHNPERYAAKGVRADTPYPGLFVGGYDLTVGDSFSAGIVGGWLAANAIVGFSPWDHLFLQKNITSDLEMFMDSPDVDEDNDEEDVAVHFSVESQE